MDSRFVCELKFAISEMPKEVLLGLKQYRNKLYKQSFEKYANYVIYLKENNGLKHRTIIGIKNF